MPNVNAIYQSHFLNAGQLKGQSRRVTIEGARMRCSAKASVRNRRSS